MLYGPLCSRNRRLCVLGLYGIARSGGLNISMSRSLLSATQRVVDKGFRNGAFTPVRRQGFWDHRRRELTEALIHQGCHFTLPLFDEASGAV